MVIRSIASDQKYLIPIRHKILFAVAGVVVFDRRITVENRIFPDCIRYILRVKTNDLIEGAKIQTDAQVSDKRFGVWRAESHFLVRAVGHSVFINMPISWQ